MSPLNLGTFPKQWRILPSCLTSAHDRLTKARLQTHPAPSPGRIFALATAGVLLVRLWVLFQLADSPFLAQDHGDSGYYLRWAARIAAGQWTDGQAFLGLPLYPYFLAVLQLLHLPFPWIPLLLQALADAATGGCVCLGIVTSAGQLGRSALVAGGCGAVGWAFYTPAQSFAVTLMPNPPATFIFTAALVFLLRRRLHGRPLTAGLAAVSGFALGFAAMLSANLLFLVPLFALAAWPSAGEFGSRVSSWLAKCALLLVGVGLGASPSWLHNYYVAGEPVALSAHSGINFYIGNNAQATGYPNFPAGIRASQEGLLEDSARLAEARLGRPLRRFEVSAYWNGEAAKFISESRGLWLRLIFAKIRNYYSIYEYDDISVIRPLRMLGVTTPGWGFGVLGIAAAAGLILGWRRPVTRWAAAAVVLHTLSVLPAFVTERYRLMAAPALLLIAGSGMLAGWEERQRRGAPIWLVALLATGATAWVVTSAPRPGGVDTLADYNTAVRLLEAGERQLALPLIQRIEASDASNAEVALLLGNYWQEADPARALAHYRRAIERDPGLLRAWNNAAVLAIQQKQWPLAEQLVAHLQRAVPPGDSRIPYYTAQIALAKRELEAARRAIESALRLRPDEPLYRQLADEISAARSSP